MIFLVLYAFGCELWAPWSEELGRKPILQLSLFLVNIWNLPVALAPNFASLMVGRALGGICSAGGSVTLGMVADMWDSDHQQYAVAYVVFSSVGGSVLGPVVYVHAALNTVSWTLTKFLAAALSKSGSRGNGLSGFSSSLAWPSKLLTLLSFPRLDLPS